MSIALYTDLKELFSYGEIMWEYDISEIMTIRNEYADIEKEKKKYLDSVSNSSK